MGRRSTSSTDGGSEDEAHRGAEDEDADEPGDAAGHEKEEHDGKDGDDDEQDTWKFRAPADDDDDD